MRHAFAREWTRGSGSYSRRHDAAWALNGGRTARGHRCIFYEDTIAGKRGVEEDLARHLAGHLAGCQVPVPARHFGSGTSTTLLTRDPLAIDLSVAWPAVGG